LTLDSINFLLAYPANQHSGVQSILAVMDSIQCPLQTVLAGAIAGHAHGALDDFGKILRLFLQSSIFQTMELLQNPERFITVWNRTKG